jgi:hypothetical protein
MRDPAEIYPTRRMFIAAVVWLVFWESISLGCVIWLVMH